MLRHYYARDTDDEESGLPHIAHAAASALILVWYEMEEAK
jgi:hypothetical protein